jgi:hypothetical protein
MARLRGQVEMAAPSPTLPEKIQATVEYMRKSGASETDIEAFLKQQTA